MRRSRHHVMGKIKKKLQLMVGHIMSFDTVSEEVTEESVIQKTRSLSLDAVEEAPQGDEVLLPKNVLKEIVAPALSHSHRCNYRYHSLP